MFNVFRNQAEVEHTCRGTINLANAKIVSSGATTFVISNSSTQTFHLRAANEIEQKKWVAALTFGKAKVLALGKSGILIYILTFMCLNNRCRFYLFGQMRILMNGAIAKTTRLRPD